MARLYEGRRSRSSGAAVTDEGDVATKYELIECKHTGKPTKPAKSISVNLRVLEKIVDEARETGKVPGLALRMYNPDSYLADRDGMIDVMVRLMPDDLERHILWTDLQDRNLPRS